jgi:hypothetical protein
MSVSDLKGPSDHTAAQEGGRGMLTVPTGSKLPRHARQPQAQRPAAVRPRIAAIPTRGHAAAPLDVGPIIPLPAASALLSGVECLQDLVEAVLHDGLPPPGLGKKLGLGVLALPLSVKGQVGPGRYIDHSQ